MSAGDSTTQGNPDPAIRREPAASPGHEPALSIEEQRWLLHTPESWLRAILADLFTGQPDDNWSAAGFDPLALWVVRQARRQPSDHAADRRRRRGVLKLPSDDEALVAATLVETHRDVDADAGQTRLNLRARQD